MYLSIMLHKFSIKLRSGDFEGQSIILMTSNLPILLASPCPGALSRTIVAPGRRCIQLKNPFRFFIAFKKTSFVTVSFCANVYGTTNGNGRDQLTLETLLSSQTVTELTKKLERIVASVHEMRTAAARGTVTIMQKDETCFSKPKRGGNNRPARIRQGGSTWANLLTQTSRSRKAEQIFVSTLEDRRSSSTNDPVF